MNGAFSLRMATHCHPSASYVGMCADPHQRLIALNLADNGFCSSRCRALHGRIRCAAVSVFYEIYVLTS